MHNVHFKSLRDMMQIIKVSEQLGPASELVDRYRDAMSVIFWLICRHE